MTKPKSIDFLIKPKERPTIQKVSVKLLLTPQEEELLDNYSILSGLGKNEVCSFSVKRLLRGDKKFRKLMDEMSPITQKKLVTAKLKKGETPKTKKIKKVVKKLSPKKPSTSPSKPFEDFVK